MEAPPSSFAELGAGVILGWHDLAGMEAFRKRFADSKESDDRKKQRVVDYRAQLKQLFSLPLVDPATQRAIAMAQRSGEFEWAYGEPIPDGLWESSMGSAGLDRPKPENLGELAKQVLASLDEDQAAQSPEQQSSEQPEQGTAGEGAGSAVERARKLLSPSSMAALHRALSLRRSDASDTAIESHGMLAGFLEIGREQQTRAAAKFLLQHLASQLLRPAPSGGDISKQQQAQLLAILGVKASRATSRFQKQAPPLDAFNEEGRYVLEQALELSTLVLGEEAWVGARHVIGVLLASPRPLAVQKTLADAGLALIEARKALLDFLENETEVKDDFARWREYLGRASDPEGEAARRFRATIDADVVDADGPDLIGIDDDAAAFASLIAARDVKPPLSIGLFGDWGSGKTFFMGRLRRHVNRLAKDARESGKMQKDNVFYKRIVQIDFNAWHYAEGNLWASLVEHIFSNLSTSPDDHAGVIEKRQQELLEKLQIKKEALDKAQERVRQAKGRLRNAKGDLQAVEDKLAAEEKRMVDFSFKDVFDGLKLKQQITDEAKKILEDAGKTEVGKSAKELRTSLEETRGLFERTSRLITPLLKAKDRGRRFWLMVAAVLAGPVLGMAVGWLANLAGLVDLQEIFAGGTGLAAMGTAAAAWIKKQNQWVSDWLDKAEAVQKKIDERADARAKARDAAVAKLKQRVEKLQSEFGAAKKEVATAERGVKEAETQLAEETGGRMLARFIAERASSKDYEAHLGLVALIRRDFEHLSQLLEGANRELMKMEKLEEEEAGADQRINRIVLYIDDLDRCPPDKVVEVLQAVHLLLAFPLFVVVVGVDSRWISRSLRNHYKELFQRLDGEEAMLSRTATPHDYLEKIFQVPFWLQPMGEDGVKRMVTGLLEGSVVAPKRVTAGTTGSNGDPSGGGDGKPADPQTTGTAPQPGSEGKQVPDGAKGSSAAGQQGGAGGPGSPPPPKVDPEALEMKPEELEFMGELASVLGRTPRSLKRFVNTYRLIKVRLDPPVYRTFLHGEGLDAPYRAVMFLLAIVTGAPTLSDFTFLALTSPHSVQLLNRRRSTGSGTGGGARGPKWNDDLGVNWLMRSLAAAPGFQETAELAAVEEWLATHEHSKTGAWSDDATFQVLRDWAPTVARYSFRVEQRLSQELAAAVEEATAGAAPPAAPR